VTFHLAKETDQKKFDLEQAKFRQIVSGLLADGLKPDQSDEDMGFLLDETMVQESVANVGGDEQDYKNMLTELYWAVDYHRELYGHDPSPGQMAAVGSAIAAFKEWDELKNLRTDGGDGQIIAESVANVGSTTENFNIVPQFMTIAALLPLITIAPQFCHSVGAPFATDKLTVYELFEMIGSNPYGLTEGTDINGQYNGELSNTGRLVNADETADGIIATFTEEPAYPITKNKVFLYVNKRRIAKDNGAGTFVLTGDGKITDAGATIGITTSAIVYATGAAGSETSTISVTFDGAVPSGLEVWFGVETDVEDYPAFVSETKYETRGFDLYSSSNIIRTGITLQAVLRAMRNHKIQLKDMAFSRLLTIVAADVDREALRRINKFREGTQDFDQTLVTGLNAYEQWSRIRETLNLMDHNMAQNTDGASGMIAVLIDTNLKLLFKNMGSKWVNLAKTANNPALTKQPHYFGDFENYKLFYSPLNAANEGTGIGRGTRISECATVLGSVTPPLPHQHGTQTDLAKRCTLYQEKINDQPPEARKYTMKLTLSG
jgi:hypothetical protein